METQGVLQRALDAVVGPERSEWLFQVLEVPQALIDETGSKDAETGSTNNETGPTISRAGIAQALNMMLFDGLLARVPDARLYTGDCLRDGKKIMHDHGAVRTVALTGMGALPAGEEAITRILRPLGYALNGVYPLDRLKMTGRSHAQVEFPEELAQFFISELHPERFSPAFRAAVARVMSTCTDPLTPEAVELLAELDRDHELPLEKAIQLLPVLNDVFTRRHEVPSIEDYEILLAESAEMAWISTEGNAFNHATDRVADVDAVAAEQKRLGRAMKATVETSATGRVRQTAFLAERVHRSFRAPEGQLTGREVNGSFYEFITRLPLPEEEGKHGLDLSFDSANAQAIFKMTATGGK